ncbi:MAG: hypothetical protein IPP59_03765, partial [Betaproteobacteria bacterium]|nr:hypothetical protein [Candidatus Dechloromonas phosphorivorans]
MALTIRLISTCCNSLLRLRQHFVARRVEVLLDGDIAFLQQMTDQHRLSWISGAGATGFQIADVILRPSELQQL